MALAMAACYQEPSVMVGTITPTPPPASPPATPTPACQDPQEALARARPATLLLVAKKGIGTAVVVDPRGEAVTAAHLVDDGEMVALLPSWGEAVLARVAGRHPEAGLALLIMERGGPSPSLAWAPADPLEGQEALVVGYPLGPPGDPATYSTVVSRYLELGGVRYVQVAQELAAGFAGAPVVDLCGRLAGIAVARVRDVPGLSLAVAVSSARLAVESIPAAPPPEREGPEAMLALARAHVLKEGFLPTDMEAYVEVADGLFLAVHSRCFSHLYCQKVHFFLDETYLGTDTLRPSRSILNLEPGAQGRILVTYANYAPEDLDNAPSLPPVSIPYWWDGERLRAGGVPPGH